MAIDWINKYEAFTYMSSCLYASHLFVGYMTTSNTVAIDNFWTETGTKLNSFTPNNIYKIQSLRSAGEAGIYGLVKNEISDPHEFMLVLWEVESGNKLSEISTIKIEENELLGLENSTDVGTPFYGLNDKLYNLTQLFLYYPNGEVEHEPPGIILAGQIDPIKNIGLVMYTYRNDPITPCYYNPFTDLSRTPSPLPEGKHLFCDSSKEYYLANEFKCVPFTSGTPPSVAGYYNTGKNNVYHLCHETCRTKECSGPLRNQCKDCDNSHTYSSLLGQCMQTSPGSDAFKFGKNFENGPTYAFNLRANFNTSFPYHYSNEQETFSEKSCIKISIKNLLPIPEEFSIGFWYHNPDFTTKTIMYTFGDIKISYSPTGSPTGSPEKCPAEIKYSINNGPSTQLSFESKVAWYYVGISVKNTATGCVMMAYLYQSGDNEASVGTKKSSFITYANDYSKILLNCEISNGNPVDSNTNKRFPKNVFYIPRYYAREDFDIAKSLGYDSDLQVKNSYIGYWNYDSSKKAFYDQIGQNPSTETITNEPTKNSDSDLRNAMKVESKWGIVGNFLDLFGYSNFPQFSFDTLNFGANELQPKINLNPFASLSGIIKDGDSFDYYLKGCSGTKIGTAKIELNLKNKVVIEENKKFSINVRGKYIDTCYHSRDLVIHLGRTYFPLLPTQIYPPHGKSDSGSTTPIKFELYGGDQSYGDKLTLINMGKDVLATIKETVLVDEKDNGYASYSTIKRTNGLYDGIITSELDRGVYTLGWRPSYMPYLANEKDVIYKNLFNTWTLQGPPMVRFPPLENVPGYFKNTVLHKSEFYYLDLVGEGQADGDQVIFCHTGCNYPNAMSKPFQREDGRYPPIWIGDDAENEGIFGISEKKALGEKLFVCWRPAARVAYIEPDDDQWSPLPNLQSPKTNAYITINSVSSTKLEIMKISLTKQTYSQRIASTSSSNTQSTIKPIVSPVLYQGETIWFNLNKPCAFNPGGKIEIRHVTYNTYDRTSYELDDPIWIEEFSQTVGNSLTVGKLKRPEDNTQTYILQEIPYSTMRPGNDYMLIIYGGGFKCTYPLGSDSNTEAHFKYLFKYQESIFTDSKTSKYAPSNSKITFKGTNFGNLIIPGNGFMEYRKLFSVAVDITANPPCSSEEIRASYIPENIEQNPTDIVLEGLDLTSCTDSNVISANVRLIKVADDFADFPLWSITNSSQQIELGTIACDSSCKTCNGPTSFDCLTCDLTGKFPYLYKSRCLSKCESDRPYINIIFYQNSYTLAYYECKDNCGSGYYLNNGTCVECNYQCGNCSSGSPKSCTSCKGTYINDNSTLNYMNLYRETYAMDGMCLLDCPVIYKDEPDRTQNVISQSNITHKCYVNHSLMMEGNFELDVQPVIFPERVNIKRSVLLRAILTDSRNYTIKEYEPFHANYIWSSHPAEAINDEFLNSDKRSFQNYSNENIKRAVTSLNMNAFNYKSDNDQMRLIVRAWSGDYFNFSMFELYGNRPPELDDNNIVIKLIDKLNLDVVLTSSDTLSTGQSINIEISNIQDADDYFEILTFKVILVPRSLVIPKYDETIVTTPSSALSLLAQLDEQFIVIYNNKRVDSDDDKKVILENIKIPNIINGYQPISVSDNLYSNTVSCDLYVYAEDRHVGISKSKFIFNIKESYEPETMSDFIFNLTTEMEGKNNAKTFGWDDVLRIAHTLRAINPAHSVYYMSYTQCTRDDQCSNGGKCVTSGGWSECVCAKGFAGVSCGWNANNLFRESSLIDLTIKFLNTTLLIPVSTKSDYIIDDISIIDQLANVLIGILKNPEPVSEKYFECIAELTRYMTQINYTTAGRMEDFERSNIFNAIDYVVKYLYYHLRTHIYEYYALGEAVESFTDAQVVEFNKKRQTLYNVTSKIIRGLYNFSNAISIIQYPLESPYSVEYDTFELFLSAEQEFSMFSNLRDNLAIQMRSEGDYIKIPSSILKKIRKEVSINEEFKVRVVKWKENPYVFSEYHSEVCTPLFSFVIMDSDSKLIDMEFNEPVIFFTPTPKKAKNFETEAVHCMYFDHNNTNNSRISNHAKINVNQLPFSDEEKMKRYPEWNPEFYHSKNLIIVDESYTDGYISYPEFVKVRGSSSYSNVLGRTEYTDMISCAIYGADEVAGVAERKLSHTLGAQSLEFYYNYNSLDNIYFCIGLYVCVIIGSLLIVFMIISYVLDIFFIPMHNKMIMLHRPEYVEKDQASDSNITNNMLISVNSNSLEGSDGREEDVKIGIDMGGEGGHKRRSTKMHGKHKLIKKRGNKNRSGVNDTSKSGITQKEASTEDKLNNNQTTNSGINQSQTRMEIKEGGDTNNTTQNRTTTQELVGSTLNWSTSDPQKTNSEDLTLKNLFSNVKPADIHKKNKEDNQKIENIFSKEHLEQREIREYQFLNIYGFSNLLLNLIFRNNNIYTRPARCFVMFCYFYLMMFWSAVFTSTVTDVLISPEKHKNIQFLAEDTVWILFVSPILSSILLYLIAGVYKVDEGRIRDAKTALRYKQVM